MSRSITLALVAALKLANEGGRLIYSYELNVPGHSTSRR